MPKRSVTPEERWRAILTRETIFYKRQRHAFGLLPAEERCKNCNAPFTGIGRVLMLMMGRTRYRRNPRFCNY